MIIFKGFLSYRVDTNIHKKAPKGRNLKVLKRGLLFLYATHRHDLFYITVKYHQHIPYGIQVIERTRKCLRTDAPDGRTDGRQAHRYIPRTFLSGDKNLLANIQISQRICIYIATIKPISVLVDNGPKKIIDPN